MKKIIIGLLFFLSLTAGYNRAMAQYFGVGMNIPALMTGTVNLSFEAAIAPHWSVDIPIY